MASSQAGDLKVWIERAATGTVCCLEGQPRSPCVHHKLDFCKLCWRAAACWREASWTIPYKPHSQGVCQDRTAGHVAEGVLHVVPRIDSPRQGHHLAGAHPLRQQRMHLPHLRQACSEGCEQAMQLEPFACGPCQCTQKRLRRVLAFLTGTGLMLSFRVCRRTQPSYMTVASALQAWASACRR